MHNVGPERGAGNIRHYRLLLLLAKKLLVYYQERRVRLFISAILININVAEGGIGVTSGVDLLVWVPCAHCCYRPDCAALVAKSVINSVFTKSPSRGILLADIV